MSLYVKELIVVLGISGFVFALGRRAALNFIDESDFKRRRNIWLILSVTAFLSPSFWLFTLVAAPILYLGGKRDKHPLAFYLLLMNVIPSVPIQIPTDGLGINQLFSLDIFRLLSLCVLLPAASRLRKSQDPDRIRGLRTMDVLLIGYGILQVVLYVPPDLPGGVILHTSPTNILREAFLFSIDVYILYYVASRASTTRPAIVDAMASFCLACTIMASVAIFESLRHWLLYSDFYARWGVSDRIAGEYLFRSDLLRARASSGHYLALGYLLAIAFGFWLYLQSRLNQSAVKIAVSILLWLGLYASFSRGPWLGGVAIYFAYAAFGPGRASRLFKAVLACLVLGGLVLASPIGGQITNTLPFLGGKIADSSLVYRERLVERSWQLIQAHPFFGDQNALSQMQDLRQGQGIIDMVDAYVGVTLFYGFVGLSLFLAFILLALSKAYRAARAPPSPDTDWQLLGASLAACIVGTLLMIADCAFFLGYVILFFVLAGISAAYFEQHQPLRARDTTGASAVRPSEVH